MATTKQDDTWESFSLAQYLEVARPLVHQSFKTVNSNAAGGGVRIDPSRALRLPYIAARTLMRTRSIELDGFAGGAAALRKVKQLNWARQGHALCPPAEREELLRLLAATTQHGAEFNADVVDPRMRQVLIPAPQQPGGYVALTPITPAGVCKLALDAAMQRNEDAKQFNAKRAKGEPFQRSVRFAQMGFGGSNPQNVGLLVRQMQRPFYFSAPVANQEIRIALSIYFRGPQLVVPRRALNAYRLKRKAWRSEDTGSTALPVREAERQMALAIVRPVLAHLAEQARRMARALPGIATDGAMPRFADGVSPQWRILAGGGAKDASARGDAATFLARRLNEEPLDDNSTLGLDQGGVDALAGWIEELLP